MVLVPQGPHVRWPSIVFACYSLSHTPEECFVLHVTVSIQFKFLFRDLKNLFSCMLQSPILFSFLQCISRMWEGLYLLFFWDNATGNFCGEKKQNNPFNLFLPYEKESFKYLFERWKTFENLLQRKEKLRNELYNNRFNHKLYRAACIHFDYATPVLRENVNVHVRTLDKTHKNKFLSPPSTWAWSEQPTSLTVLSASERWSLLQKAKFQHSLQQIIFSIHENVIIYTRRNWNSKWNE